MMNIKDATSGFAFIIIGICGLVSFGYHWAKDDSFNEFISTCEKQGVIHHVINNETRHIQCQPATMNLEWVEQ